MNDNAPAMRPKQGKVWGETMMAFAMNGIESHCLFAKACTYCSTHSHAAKWNRFFVLSGKLRVCLYSDDGKTIIDQTIVRPWQVTDVPPGIRHSFEALEDTYAVEYYWTDLDPDDIDRHGTQGGVR